MTMEKNTYLSVFECLTDSAFILDMERRILNLNTAAAAILEPSLSANIPAAEAGAPNAASSYIGYPIKEALPWAADAIADLQQTNDTREAREATTTIGNVERWFDVRFARMHDVNEKSATSLVTLRDVTDRKRAEEAFHLQTSALEAAANGIVITDAESRITWVNPAFTRLTGYRFDEAVGQNPRILKSGLHPEPFYQALRETILAGRIWHGDITNRRKNGSLYTEEMTITPVPDKHGRITHFIAVKQDVTERKRTQEQLQHYAASLEAANTELEQVNVGMQEANAVMHDVNAELHRKNAELDEFTYVASHDLQEPIRKLISFGTLLRADLGTDLPENARRDLDFITDAARRMQALVQDLLKLSRAGRAAMKHEPIPLAICAGQAMDALATRIEETHAEIQQDALPEVVGDATLLTQLYQNLISNALKFVKPGGQPVIHLTAEHTGRQWVLGVRDNGIGIRSEHAEQVFAPFKRLHGHSEYEGTGIGLAICRKTVERHGGRIWIESEPGQGSHFRFTLEHTAENAQCGHETANGLSSSW